MTVRSWARVPALIGALGIFPLLALVLRRGVDVPFWDEWEWTDLVYEAHKHTLTFAGVWAPHNEHRILVPNLIMLALDRVGGWSPVREQMLSLAMLAAMQFVVWLLLRRTVNVARRGLCFLAASALMLGLAQYENLSWGFQMAWFACNLFMVVAVWQLTRGSRSPWPLRFALVAATVASLSSSQGLIVWPAGLIALALVPRYAAVRATVWVVTGVVVVAIVRSGSFVSGGAPHEGFARGALLMAEYCLTYLGGSVAFGFGQPDALLAGCVVVLALGALVVVALRAPIALRVRLAPWVAIGGYAVMCGVVTAAGRAGIGLAQANSSRYISISELAWVAALAGMCVVLPRGNARRFSLAAGLACVLLVASIEQSTLGNAAWRDRAARVRSGRAAIAAGNVAGLAAIYPDPKRVARLLGELAEIHDGVFLRAAP